MATTITIHEARDEYKKEQVECENGHNKQCYSWIYYTQFSRYFRTQSPWFVQLSVEGYNPNLTLALTNLSKRRYTPNLTLHWMIMMLCKEGVRWALNLWLPPSVESATVIWIWERWPLISPWTNLFIHLLQSIYRRFNHILFPLFQLLEFWFNKEGFRNLCCSFLFFVQMIGHSNSNVHFPRPLMVHAEAKISTNKVLFMPNKGLLSSMHLLLLLQPEWEKYHWLEESDHDILFYLSRTLHSNDCVCLLQFANMQEFCSIGWPGIVGWLRSLWVGGREIIPRKQNAPRTGVMTRCLRGKRDQRKTVLFPMLYIQTTEENTSLVVG